MRGLIQRVTGAEVRVDGRETGAIGPGILLLLGVAAGDGEAEVEKMLHKVLNYRIFPDDAGRMNRSLLDCRAEILTVSQFTLAADTRRGLRPGFSTAAPPAQAQALYDSFLTRLRDYEPQGIRSASGRFGADMQVSLVNDGPVTFMLEVGGA